MVAALQAVTPNTAANVLPAVGFLLAWTTLYFLLCLLNPRRSYEWHVRSVTTVHAVLVCSLSGWSSFILGPWPFTDPGGPMTRLEYVTCNVCLGYFLFDFAWCLFFQTEGLIMVLHHLLSIVGNASIVYWALSGTEMVATIFGSELTNPLLQLRWFLRQTGCHRSMLGELNDAAFMMLFCVMRVGVGTLLLCYVLTHPRPCFLVKLGGALHYAVGWTFFLQIIRYAVRKYRKLYRVHQEAVERSSSEALTDSDQCSTRLPDTRPDVNGLAVNGVVHQKQL